MHHLLITLLKDAHLAVRDCSFVAYLHSGVNQAAPSFVETNLQVCFVSRSNLLIIMHTIGSGIESSVLSGSSISDIIYKKEHANQYMHGCTSDTHKDELRGQNAYI